MAKRKADCTPEEWVLIAAKMKTRRDKWLAERPTYQRDWKRKQREENPAFVAKIAAARGTPEGRIRELWFQARYRAKKRGLDFDIELRDLLPPPTHCCVFPWVELNYGAGDKNDANRASIDRIDNSKGYVKGNVKIISRRANTIKCDATFLEIQRVLDYVRGSL